MDPYLEGLIEVLDDADRIRDEAFALLFKLHGYVVTCIMFFYMYRDARCTRPLEKKMLAGGYQNFEGYDQDRRYV